MEEKILQTKKNGMVMLLLTLLGYAVTVLLFFYSIILLDESLFPGILLTILSIAYWVAGIFLLCGLKVLKPQEALVLTLFGNPPAIEHQDPVSLFNRRQPMGNDQGGATSQEAVECLVQGILGSGIQC